MVDHTSTTCTCISYLALFPSFSRSLPPSLPPLSLIILFHTLYPPPPPPSPSLPTSGLSHPSRLQCTQRLRDVVACFQRTALRVLHAADSRPARRAASHSRRPGARLRHQYAEVNRVDPAKGVIVECCTERAWCPGVDTAYTCAMSMGSPMEKLILPTHVHNYACRMALPSL